VFSVRIRGEAQVWATGGSQVGWFNVWDRAGSRQRVWISDLKFEILERDGIGIPLPILFAAFGGLETQRTLSKLKDAISIEKFEES